MENKKTPVDQENEEKIGNIPVSQIKGSDADTASEDDDAVDKLAEQTAKSDSDVDEQTDKNNAGR
ncbi:MAG: hypothetical protein J7577_20060 [Sphingobacteriaceae bacterium]|nr:hypothetical protein [Sphingobacteriaceae bacterium]